MSDLDTYLAKRNISSQQMHDARLHTQMAIEAYRLQEARKAASMTQVQLASAMGVSQNRISRIESGDIGSMSLDSIRRYVEALGGKLTLIADLPDGTVSLV